jgi:peptidyl-prolyl cis-trans isomerase SurA
MLGTVHRTQLFGAAEARAAYHRGHRLPLLTSLLLASILLAIAGGVSRRAGAEPVVLDGIAAQVGSEVVLLSEVQELARPVEERMRQAGAPEAEIRAMHSEALERLIEAKLIESVVKRLELQATETEIDNAITGIAQDTGLTLEQLQRSVESHGLTLAEYRVKIKGEIERSKVLNSMVRSRVRIQPGEVSALFSERYGKQRSGGEEIHLRHILVAFGADNMRDQRTACVIAEDAARKIQAGEIGFQDMARRVSDMNPERAGELGWLHADEVAGWMASAVEKLEPGQTSDVIATDFGCNLLQLVERREAKPVRFEDVEAQLTQELTNRRMDQEYLTWLETLRKQTYVARMGVFAQQPGFAEVPDRGVP